jgi:hypothetical protein
MSFANVNIGATPGDGTGDPLRTAFEKINQNFANIANGSITVTSPVQSVAGRSGNIILTINDIIGGNTVGQSYTMGNTANWTSAVHTVDQALDQLAQRLTSAGF